MPNNRFEDTAAALSAGARLDPRTDLRLVARYETSTVGTPGPTAYGRPDLDASFERDDLVLAALLRRNGPTVVARSSASATRSPTSSR